MAEWVYVEDGLPAYRQRVLVSMRHKNYPSNDRVSVACRVKTDVEGEWWEFDQSMAGPMRGVTAWTPLAIAPPLRDQRTSGTEVNSLGSAMKDWACRESALVTLARVAPRRTSTVSG